MRARSAQSARTARTARPGRQPLPLLALLATILLSLPTPARAQDDGSPARARPALPDTMVLDLDTVIEFALEHSWSMEQERMDLRRDRFNLEASRAALKSNADLSFTVPDFDQSIKELNDPDTGDPKVLSNRGARYSSILSIRQPIPTDGIISLNGVLNRTQDGLIDYSPDSKTYYGRLFLRFEQPIPWESIPRKTTEKVRAKRIRAGLSI